jgi:DUF4097 and DUF4098 domain-containing protein YvlB
MRRSAHSRPDTIRAGRHTRRDLTSRDREGAVPAGHHTSRALWKAAALLLPLVGLAQPLGQRNPGEWLKDFIGSEAAGRRLRVNSHGPVTVQAGVSSNVVYTVRVTVHARTEAEAKQVLARYSVRSHREGDTTVINVPGGPVVSNVTVRTPRLDFASVTTSDGAVEVTGVDGQVTVDTGAGELKVDRIAGDCKLNTGGGDVQAGVIGGALRCNNGAGKITVGVVGGEAILETVGGDILATEIRGPVRAQTGGGGIHIGRAGAGVNAGTAGGPIVVDHAGGLVFARNMAGPVQVGAAGGVQCESGAGGVRLTNIAGPMRVSTSLGNIMAALLGGKLADSFLATGNGDITVMIPSNVGVNIHAENDLADTMRRITSEFPSVAIRRQGRALVADGKVNGGGPLLQISATLGTIHINKQ